MDFLNRKDKLFDICIFTSKEALLAFSESQHIDILLLEEALFSEELLHRLPGRILLLSEESCVKEEDGCPVLQKLQPAENIEREILALYLAGSPRLIKSTKNGSKIELWGIFSPAGGCGKTTLALALGKYLSKEKSVLYLNLESFGGLVGEGQASKNMTDLLYYVKERKENLFLLLPSLTENCQGVDCIFPVDYYGDLLSLTEQDVDYLVGELEKSRYESVILDMGCVTQEMVYLLSHCRRILLPRRREEERGKLVSLERSLRMEGREEVFLRMEKVVLPSGKGQEMERFLWQLTQGS
jgi:hypothetical protein